MDRDGCKTIPATILSFRLRHRQTSQNAFRRSWATASKHFARLPRLARKSKISLRNSFATISSSFTQYYRTVNGFEFSTKTSFPYFFDPICEKCSIREQNKCFEGFYGPRIEKRQGGYYVRLCLYRHNYNTLLPWQNFLSSGLANEMKNIFQQV